VANNLLRVFDEFPMLLTARKFEREEDCVSLVPVDRASESRRLWRVDESFRLCCSAIWSANWEGLWDRERSVRYISLAVVEGSSLLGSSKSKCIP
jgi:hypothetical protein